MAGNNVFWYEGPVTNGERISGLTYAEAAELQKQEDEMVKQQESDALLGPQVSAGIREYESQRGPQQQQLQTSGAMAGIAEPVPDSVKGAAKLDQQSFNDAINTAVDEQKQEPTGVEQFQGTPSFDMLTQNARSGGAMEQMAPTSEQWEGFTPERQAEIEQSQERKQRQMSAPMISLFKGVPEEVASDLIAQYRMGTLKPNAFIKQVTDIKKTLRAAEAEEKKSAFESKLKIEEQAEVQSETTRRTLEEIESREKIAKWDNALKERLANLKLSEDPYENARQQQAALRAAEFSEKEKTMLIASEEGKQLLTGLVNTFRASGFGDPTDVGGEAVAGIPFAGKFMAQKTAAYNNQKKLASETWLRAATGAAAPPKEVATYMSFLPNPSDPPEIAQKKIQNFFDKISAKAEASAKVIDIEGKGLEKRGIQHLADVKYEKANLIRGLVRDARAAIPSIYDGPVEEGTETAIEEETLTEDQKALRSTYGY